MTGIILKIIIGLFIWLVLPEILFSKKRLKKNTRLFIKVVCVLIGLVVLIYAGLDVVNMVLKFE